MQVKKAKSVHIISFFNPTKILLTSSLLGYKYKYRYGYLKFLTTASTNYKMLLLGLTRRSICCYTHGSVCRCVHPWIVTQKWSKNVL